jgi:type I restriction-modification system DNA methylase subunit
MAFFQNSVLNKYLNTQDAETVKVAYQKFTAYFHNPAIQQNIRDAKEEQFQEGFLRELFVDILGYALNPQPNYNLTTELKNEKGAKKADGAILQNGKALGVIELKGADTKDLDKINVQAFNYKNNQTGCVYVITSNFEKLRFFIHHSVEHLEFNLFTLTETEFRLLWLCLRVDNLLSGIPLKVKEESLLEEEKITKQLYKDYASFRNDLWQNMVKNSDAKDKLLLFKKTQKLLDRYLFIFFAEDSGLLPPNSISRIVSRWEVLKEEDAYKPLYEIFKQYFGYINKGRKGQKTIDDIFAYNGGLFLPDEVLDNIILDDEMLHPNVMKLTKYDYQSEVDVNILGHIFENSLNEIENITAELEGQEIDKSKSKRKKDGVFYTPKYITKYIVDNTVGKLCEEKKAELYIIDEEYAKGRRNRKKETVKSLDENLQAYRNWLLNITICDPACGSGAFLNQALEFLMEEHAYVDELKAQLFGSSIVFQDVSNHILEKNIFGVDINEESVDIAKLSLWLRTAQRGRKLTTLNNNIKCGNSLIDESSVAGEKAFNWQEEFPTVFEKGGFDAVIGNPPYGILIDKKSQSYFNEHFPLTQYKTNLYILFVERMLQIFDKGIIHFIIPKSLLFNTYYEAIRKELIQKTELNEIYTITEKVFEDAEVGSSLLLQFTIKQKINQKNTVRLAVADKIQNFVTEFGVIENKVPQDFFLNVPNCEISVVSSDSQSILKKLHKLKPIKQYYTLKNGLNPGNIKQVLISESKETEKHKPIIWGKEITRYNITWGGNYINYDENIGANISIDNIKSKEGMNKQNRIDFALRSPDLFENKKIAIRKTGDSLIGCLDENNYYFDTLVHGIYEKEKGFKLEPLLAVLNSKPATKFYRLLHDIKGKVFAKISLDNLGSFPIPQNICFDSNNLGSNTKLLLSKAKEIQELLTQFTDLLQSKFEIEKLTTKLQNWHELEYKDFLKELKKAKVQLSLSEEAKWMQYFNEQKQKAQALKAEINRVDAEIDKMVYELYGLTEEEIKIVEEN